MNETLAFSALPALHAELCGGTFVGITTLKDGAHFAVVLLPNKAQERMTWKKAAAWAAEAGGKLPSRPVAALLYANAKSLLAQVWHWTADTLDQDTGDESDASSAWGCYFRNGYQNNSPKSAEGAAVAVRLIPLTA